MRSNNGEVQSAFGLPVRSGLPACVLILSGKVIAKRTYGPVSLAQKSVWLSTFNPGYERWAKVFNLKQMAAALAFLQDNGLTDYEQLEQKATADTERFHKLSDQIKSTEAALHANMELKAAMMQYAKTRPVFETYKASKYSKKFLAEHEADIELYRAACADFKAILGGAKLPKMDTLKEEGRKLAEQKKKLYAEYRKAKADMQEVTTIKANIDYLLGYSEPGRKKEQER